MSGFPYQIAFEKRAGSPSATHFDREGVNAPAPKSLQKLCIPSPVLLTCIIFIPPTAVAGDGSSRWSRTTHQRGGKNSSGEISGSQTSSRQRQKRQKQRLLQRDSFCFPKVNPPFLERVPTWEGGCCLTGRGEGLSQWPGRVLNRVAHGRVNEHRFLPSGYSKGKSTPPCSSESQECNWSQSPGKKNVCPTTHQARPLRVNNLMWGPTSLFVKKGYGDGMHVLVYHHCHPPPPQHTHTLCGGCEEAINPYLPH